MSLSSSMVADVADGFADEAAADLEEDSLHQVEGGREGGRECGSSNFTFNLEIFMTAPILRDTNS